MEQELRISQRAKQYPASGIRKMFDLAAQYPEAIKLTVGEPNFETPQYIKDAAKRALDEGQTHYAPNAGTTELREAVAAKYRKQYWEGYTKDHVIITVGAMEGLFLAMMTLLDPGDEILVPDPCFPNYYGQASSIGARAVPVPTYEEYDYRIQAADIEKAVTPRTRAILLNSPCNPTGAVLTKEDILAIAKVAKTHDLWVLTDEPYDAIVYDGIQPYSMAQVPEMQDRVMVLNSFSKSYAMTGWRIGYLVAPEPGYIKKMAQLQEGVASCVSTFTQAAAVEALKSTACVDQMVADYTRRRDILVDGLNAIPGITCKKSAGSFYAFPNIKAFGKTSQAFAEELLENAGVAEYEPELSVLQLPYLYSDAQQMWRVLDGSIGDEFLAMLDGMDLVGLSWFDAGVRSFYTREKVTGLDDLQGLTIRVQESDMMSDMITALGAKPAQVVYSKVYAALHNAEIDGAENNWPSYEVMGHYEVAPFFLKDEHTRVPEVQLASPAVMEKLAALDESFPEVIRACARESAQTERELWARREANAEQNMRKRGICVTELDEAEKARFRAAVQPMYDAFSAQQELIDRIQKS